MNWCPLFVCVGAVWFDRHFCCVHEFKSDKLQQYKLKWASMQCLPVSSLPLSLSQVSLNVWMHKYRNNAPRRTSIEADTQVMNGESSGAHSGSHYVVIVIIVVVLKCTNERYFSVWNNCVCASVNVSGVFVETWRRQLGPNIAGLQPFPHVPQCPFVATVRSNLHLVCMLAHNIHSCPSVPEIV